MLIHTQTKEFSFANFHIFELHTHASDFSGSVKRQTLPPYFILIYTLLWLCAENCTLITTNARLSTLWELTKCTMSVMTTQWACNCCIAARAPVCLYRCPLCHWLHSSAACVGLARSVTVTVCSLFARTMCTDRYYSGTALSLSLSLSVYVRVSVCLSVYRWTGQRQATWRTHWAFTRYDRRTDWSARPSLRPTGRSDQSDRPVGQTVAEPPTSVNQINVAC